MTNKTLNDFNLSNVGSTVKNMKMHEKLKQRWVDLRKTLCLLGWKHFLFIELEAFLTEFCFVRDFYSVLYIYFWNAPLEN